jgi:hypothetical protein
MPERSGAARGRNVGDAKGDEAVEKQVSVHAPFPGGNHD